MENNYINHIGLVLDRSGSMNSVRNEVVTVADMQVQYLAQRSRELDQETRMTVYTFDTEVECVYYDKDVLRLPSLKGKYQLGGMTALMSRAHVEIAHLIRRLGRLLDDMEPDGPDADDIIELRRLLYGLHAILQLHFAQEDEGYLSLVDDDAEPVKTVSR